MANRFNFKNIKLIDEADITDVMDNFNKVEDTGAIIADLPQVSNTTIPVTAWTLNSDNYFEASISNNAIQVEPYIIDVIFDNLLLIKAPIIAKPNSQSNGSIKLITKLKPSQALTAKLVVSRGINE